MERFKPEYLRTEDSITLYWEKPVDAEKGDLYKIYVNGKQYGETEKTDINIEKLDSDTEYTVIIKCYRNGTELDSYEERISTLAKRVRIDVTKEPYNAAGDGTTLNTKALQMAIDDCQKGETVYIPKGVYLTGGLKLHSDMELFIDEGAVLLGSENPEDYLPKIHSRFEGYEMECYQSLLNLGDLDHDDGYNCINVVIRGKGKISGGGKTLARAIIESERKRLETEIAALGDKIKEYENNDTIPGRARGRLVNISNCQNVRITGLHLEKGPAWNVHMIYSDSIVMDNCSMYSRDIWNGDGWDPDSSTNCTLFACVFDTGDDSVAIKSGKNPEGNIINRPTEHIRIFDCDVKFGHGMAIGSEMSGGVRDVKIWDCDLLYSAFGVQIKGTPKRGGYVQEIHVRDVVAPRILFLSVPYNDDGIGAAEPPKFGNCSFKNIVLTSMNLQEMEDVLVPCNPIEFRGFEGEDYYIDNVSLENIHIKQPIVEDLNYAKSWYDDGTTDGFGAVIFKRCKNINISNISVE
jgi:polygalacturonase